MVGALQQDLQLVPINDTIPAEACRGVQKDMLFNSCTVRSARAGLPVNVCFVEEIAEVAERVQVPVYCMLVVNRSRDLSAVDRVCPCS